MDACGRWGGPQWRPDLPPRARQRTRHASRRHLARPVQLRRHAVDRGASAGGSSNNREFQSQGRQHDHRRRGSSRQRRSAGAGCGRMARRRGDERPISVEGGRRPGHFHLLGEPERMAEHSGRGSHDLSLLGQRRPALRGGAEPLPAERRHQWQDPAHRRLFFGQRRPEGPVDPDRAV